MIGSYTSFIINSVRGYLSCYFSSICSNQNSSLIDSFIVFAADQTKRAKLLWGLERLNFLLILGIFNEFGSGI